MPQKPTVAQLLKVNHLRARLAKQIKEFLEAANLHLPPLEEMDLRSFDDEVVDTSSDESVEPKVLLDGSLDEGLSGDEEDESKVPSTLAELVVLPLPSNIKLDKLPPPLHSLKSTERELRKGQGNNTLEGIWIDKSLLL